MNKYAISERCLRVVVWLIWFMVLVTASEVRSGQVVNRTSAPLLGVACQDGRQSGPLFPWQVRRRWKKWALQRYHQWRTEYRRAKRRVQMAKLALSGVLTMAHVVDWLTASQVRYKVGALPVLYALLQTLAVEALINRHCPTRGEVGHGTVALVLMLNRLLLPLPLYQIADWVGETCLTATLGVPAEKFNDDRLGRTLDALYPHLDTLWQAIIEQVLRKAGIDLSVLFYDVTAFMVHGRYADSDFIDFGFAHNTPSHKRKFKLGLNATADGHLPWLFGRWSGSTADQATVEENMSRLAAWLHHHGYASQESLVVADRAMMSAEIALLYKKHGLRHLTGLKASNQEQKALVAGWDDTQMEAMALEPGPSPQYWGRLGQVTLTHEGKSVRQRALVVLSGPLRDQWRQSRQAQLDALLAELETLRSRMGEPRLRTFKSVERSLKARLKASKVAQFVQATLYTTAEGELNLIWQLDQAALTAAERSDGRYLLVTNDWTLSAQKMFQLYRQKDGVEKCFRISKHDLQVSPLFLHKDKRIASMLFINLVALLAYTLLQRQLQQQGLLMTTRQLIQRLERLTLIETRCWDGSRLRRLTPIEPELLVILQHVALLLDQMMQAVVQPDHKPPLPISTITAQLPLLC